MFWLAARLPGPRTGKSTGVLAVYTVQAPAAKVLAWYHKVLRAAGWKYRETPG